METNEYNVTIQELISKVFEGCSIKANSSNGNLFIGKDFEFFVCDSHGVQLNICKSGIWKINTTIPASIERAHTTLSLTFPEGYIKEFVEMRKEWKGKIKIEMKLTPCI